MQWLASMAPKQFRCRATFSQHYSTFCNVYCGASHDLYHMVSTWYSIPASLLPDNKWTQSINNTSVKIASTTRQIKSTTYKTQLNTVKHCTSCSICHTSDISKPISRLNTGLIGLSYSTDIGYYHSLTRIRYVAEVCLNSTVIDKTDSTLLSLHNDNTAEL